MEATENTAETDLKNKMILIGFPALKVQKYGGRGQQ